LAIRIRFGDSAIRFAKSNWRFEFADSVCRIHLPDRFAKSIRQIDSAIWHVSAIRVGDSIWQIDLAIRIRFGDSAIRFGDSAIRFGDSAIRFAKSNWRFEFEFAEIDLPNPLGNSIWRFDLANRFAGFAGSICLIGLPNPLGNSIWRFDLANRFAGFAGSICLIGLPNPLGNSIWRFDLHLPDPFSG
jgi:hypothetical protein